MSQSPAQGGHQAPAIRRLAAAFAGLTVAVVGLMVLGALVRAHGAGLACPDWPLCFGEFVPRFDLKVSFEWSHRVAAGLISLVYLGLGIACFRLPTARRLVGKTLVLGFALLALQILLGALTVWKLLAAWSVTAHLLTANAFAICISFAAARLFEQAGTTGRPLPVARSLRLLVSFCMALLIFQVAVGGLVASTYAGLVCPEWPACIDGVWFPGFEGARGLHLVHRLSAYALIILLGAAAWFSRGLARLGPCLCLVWVIAVAQAGVGVANVLLQVPVEMTGLHSLLAAILVLTLALATRLSWRGIDAPGPLGVGPPAPLPGATTP